MDINRRNYLAASGGALLAAGAGALPVIADEGKNNGDVLYGHGMVWNRDLPGVAGDLKLSFDLRVNLETGVGFGTAEDPIHPDWNVHFAINSAQRQKLRGGESRYTLIGVVTRANNAANLGLPV